MLGRIRSDTLQRFKEAFDKELKGGIGFAMAARECTGTCMSQFDEGCAGTGITCYCCNPTLVNLFRRHSHLICQYRSLISEHLAELVVIKVTKDKHWWLIYLPRVIC